MNRLASETSPYLRQHQDNPVDWFPWGEEAFDLARAQGLPVLLSVGYSACHWCHVMAHECFEDDEVAAKMNELFVNVKVDREERPEVDQIYMDALVAQTGRGGWPMTVFMTPNGEPFHSGTYFPKDRFLQLLDAVSDAYTNQRDGIDKSIDAIHEKIDTAANLRPGDDLPTVDQMNGYVQALGRAHDPEWGGFGLPPKFPSTFNLELMLRAYMSSGSEVARDLVVRTLDAMCSGGMYDHLGGGFARYSTDREWNVPHFEKMLYDQALVVSTYLHALVVLRPAQWRQVVQETVEYVLNTLTHPDGGFFSAEDADSLDADGNSVEGAFYTWTEAEVRAVLHDVKPEFVKETLAWWGIGKSRAATAEVVTVEKTGETGDDGEEITKRTTTRKRLGEFDGRWIPNRMHARGELVRSDPMNYTRARLFQARQERSRPAIDDKVILEWNALFLAALSQAGAVFAHQPWLDAAVKNAEFLVREMRDEHGRWYRSWHADGDPKARHMALAADHAALVDAFTRLAEATGQARWIEEAMQVANTLLDHFYDPADGGLFTTADDAETLVVRQKDLVDNATPAANSQAAIALYRLSALTGEPRYANQADRIMHLLQPLLDEGVGKYSNGLLATDLRRRGLTEVAIVGDRPDMVRLAHSIWRPDLVLAWGERYESPLWENREDGLAYVCRDHVCEAPVETMEALAEQLLGRKVTIADNVAQPREA